jgi:hypothetical protein
VLSIVLANLEAVLIEFACAVRIEKVRDVKDIVG